MEIYKMDVIVTIWFSLATAIIVNAGDRYEGTSSSANIIIIDESDEDASPSEDYSCIYIDSDKETGPSGSQFPAKSKVDLRDDNPCWLDIKSYCNLEIPDTIDFARLAIAKWKEGDLDGSKFMLEYYNSFYNFLDAEDIPPPDRYCFEFDNQNAPKIHDGKTECQFQLHTFGETNLQALRYGFYNIKFDTLKGTRTDHRSMARHHLNPNPYQDFIGDYLKFMMEKVKFVSGMLTPSQFCKKYD